jgi:hypothetical protein
MMIVKASKNSETGAMPSEDLLAAMGKYNEKLMKAGVLVDLGGLKPTSQGVRIRFAGDQRTVIDGPFTETKELVAGYWIIRVNSFQEAIDWARQAPSPHPGEECELELRPFFELEDFAPGPAIDRFRKLGEELGPHNS